MDCPVKSSGTIELTFHCADPWISSDHTAIHNFFAKCDHEGLGSVPIQPHRPFGDVGLSGDCGPWIGDAGALFVLY